jgi:predicted small integral membrane protein
MDVVLLSSMPFFEMVKASANNRVGICPAALCQSDRVITYFERQYLTPGLISQAPAVFFR